MKEINCSKVNTKNMDKIAAKGNQNKNAVKVAFTQKGQEDQVVNARKGVNLELAKKKAKKKAKMAKASKRKNK
ncbi:hypothetical protein OAR97_08315 [Arcobacteraceae bacterium]|nr:hypothetical protein [Arcobacteraceae bacterium]